MKDKLTKIAQNAVKISFDVGFLDLIVFNELCCWFFYGKLRDSSQFWASKAAFRRNTDSLILDFLANKSIYMQTKYVVICFTPRPTQPENMSRIYFSRGCWDMFHQWERSLLIFKRYTISYCANIMAFSFCFVRWRISRKKIVDSRTNKTRWIDRQAD